MNVISYFDSKEMISVNDFDKVRKLIESNNLKIDNSISVKEATRNIGSISALIDCLELKLSLENKKTRLLGF